MRYVINKTNQFLYYIKYFLQTCGKGSTSGTFKMTILNEVIQVDFKFGDMQKPSFDFKKLNEGPYQVLIASGPYVENTTASCTFEVFDSRK